MFCANTFSEVLRPPTPLHALAFFQSDALHVQETEIVFVGDADPADCVLRFEWRVKQGCRIEVIQGHDCSVTDPYSDVRTCFLCLSPLSLSL